MYESFIFFSQIPMRQTVQSTKNGKLNIYMKFVKHGTFVYIIDNLTGQNDH